MTRQPNRGFTIIEVVVVIVVIGLIIALGYAFFARKDQPVASGGSGTTDTTQTTPSKDEPAEEVTAINSSDDLDKATKELEKIQGSIEGLSKTTASATK